MKVNKVGFTILSLLLIFLFSWDYLTRSNASRIEEYKNNFILNELQSLKQLAEKGDPESQNKIGWMYDQGIGFKENKKEAFKWYLKSARQGFQKAKTNVGVMYELGAGVPQDLEEAEKWYK